MAKLWAIASRELKSYFASPLAYVVAFIFTAIEGVFFSVILAQSREATLQGMLQNLAVVFLLTTPALTMSLIAGERSRSTMEMLLTSPVTDRDIVLGKYMASLMFLLFLVGTTLVFPVILEIFGKPDWAVIGTSYLGTILLGATFLAVGLLASSWTSNLIVAMLSAFGLMLLFWLLPAVGNIFGSPYSQAFEYMSVMSHQENLARGVIDTADIIYYLSFIAGCLFLAVRSVEVLRWR